MRGNDPDLPFNLVAAYTGNAAFQAGGHTFHSALAIRAMKGNDSIVHGLIADKTLQHLKNVFSSIKHLSGDEFTYIGSSMLSKINRHLKLIKDSRDDFGGLNIVLYGDPCQLGPIADRHIFEYNAKDPYGPIAGGTLFDQFQTFELTEILRQTDPALQNALCDLADSSTPMAAENVALLKSREKTEEEVDVAPDKRVDLFATNAEVNALNEQMVGLIKSIPYPVEATLSILGDEPKTIKEKIKCSIRDRNDHTETVGLRLSVVFKVGGRYFIPVNVNLTDGLVNGAVGTLMSVDLDNDGQPITLWIKFDHESVGVERRRLLSNCKSCMIQVGNGWTPIWKVSKNFSTCRKKLTGRVTMFPLYHAYGFTICKAQGNNHIGISTVVHLNYKRKIPRKQLYVAMSRTDTLDNLIIVGSFEDPWYREEEYRKKSKIKPRQDEIKEGYDELLSKKIHLTWTPLYYENTDSFIISFFNTNSLHSHINDVCCDYSLRASDLVFFLDTRLKDSEKPIIPGLEYIDGVCMKKTQRVPGGLCLYTKPKHDVTTLMQFLIEEKDFFFSMMVVSAYNFIVIGLYKSPKCPQKILLSGLEKALDGFGNSDKEVIIGGDFNCEADINLLLINGFVRKALNSTTKHNSMIDQIYVKSTMSHIAGVNPCYYSDHFPIFIIMNPVQRQSHSDRLNKVDIINNTNIFNERPIISEDDEIVTEYPMELDIIDKTKCSPSSQIVNTLLNSKLKTVRIIDRLNLKSSRDLISFLIKKNYHVINSNNETQVGLSCGYICACIASQFYTLLSGSEYNLIESNLINSSVPNIKSYNVILGMCEEDAQLLDSVQILKLVTHLTSDKDLPWFYTIDVNQFKGMASTDFVNVSLPCQNGKRWAVFAVNDAVLSDQQRENAAHSYHGNHWYTAIVFLN